MPLGAAASYFMEVDKRLSNTSNNEEEDKTEALRRKKELEKIRRVLSLSNIQLKECKQDDIRKTCRAITHMMRYINFQESQQV
jgi:hypothetical protein